MIYGLLDKEARTWWWFKELRKQGKAKEARELERKSIKTHLHYIRRALKNQTVLTIHNHGWSLDLGREETPYGANSSTLSGYGDLTTDYFVQACCQARVPIVEGRKLP